MRKWFYLSTVSLILFSCSGKVKTPEGVLEPQEMKEVLWDVLRMQNLAKELEMNDTTSKKVELTQLNKKVFEIHKIDSAIFERSYTWYLKHPDVFKAITDSLYVQKQREQRLEMDEAREEKTANE